MVVARYESFSKAENKHWDTLMKTFGRNDITLRSYTNENNAKGYLESGSQAIVVSIITGDLQFITIEDRTLIDSGEALVGDARFFGNFGAPLSDVRCDGPAGVDFGSV